MRHMLRFLLLSSVLALSLVPAATPAPVEAAPPTMLTVDSVEDEPDANPGDGVCRSTVTSRCTLRAAIMEANALPVGPSITLPSATFRLRISGSDEVAALGDLDITDGVSITGAGPAQTVIDASTLAQRDRVFDVRPGVTLRLTGLRVTGGLPQSPLAGGDGGGVRVLDGGSLHLTNVLVDGNQAVSAGGGIAARTKSFVWLVDSTVDNNRTPSNGGGISVADGVLTLQNSTVSRNTSGRSGGGIQYTGDWIIAENNTISSNTAGDTGGGLFLNLRAGGSYYWGYYLTVAYNVIAASTAGSGANIYVGSAPGAPRFDLRKSIVANGSRGGNCGGQPLASGGFNLEDQNSCGFTAAGDMFLTNPALGALRFDNSRTEVHPLQRNSLAVDAIRDCSGGGDQRGVSRPKDGNGDGSAHCDIGAYELDNR